MKKRNKIITGLIIGGAIGSVLGIASKNKKASELVDSAILKIKTTNKKMDEMIKPKRKGFILRFLDWLEKKGL
jgi:gas vesicle protein